MLDETEKKQLMREAERIRGIANDLKNRLDQATTADERLHLTKDYWFYRGKLEAYGELLKS